MLISDCLQCAAACENEKKKMLTVSLSKQNKVTIYVIYEIIYSISG